MRTLSETFQMNWFLMYNCFFFFFLDPKEKRKQLEKQLEK